MHRAANEAAPLLRCGHSRPTLSGYTPCGHPLAPSAEVQHRFERFSDAGWRPSQAHHFDMFVRHFPVERSYFAAASGERRWASSCIQRTHTVPCGGVTPEPKFLCGSLAELNSMPSCQVWSIGSAGETCFEETVHKGAPACQIHVFDPTVMPSDRRIARLVNRSVFQFHHTGLGTEDKVQRFGGYGGGLAAGRFWARQRRLVTMMEELKVDWIDYLKIDCERCEHYALPRFVNDALQRWGHVPVTQLQVEVHVASVFKANQTHLRTASYGRYGLWMRSGRKALPRLSPTDEKIRAAALDGISVVNGNISNNPHSMVWDLTARNMLDTLYKAGCALTRHTCFESDAASAPTLYVDAASAPTLYVHHVQFVRPQVRHLPHQLLGRPRRRDPRVLLYRVHAAQHPRSAAPATGVGARL